MSEPVYWPGSYYFYAIGNTPTVSLTRDLSPQTPGKILMLGCGDPRNVLFTVYNEDRDSERRLDITCSDIDAAILARNVLLFTMIIDNDVPSSIMWNICFDMKINRDAHSTLTSHCKKLCQRSSSRQEWDNSPYGSLLKFSTLYTLEEVRRHWQLYVDMETLPSTRQKSICDAFASQSKEALQSCELKGTSKSSSRAAGPLLYKAASAYREHMLHYSAKGVTSMTSQSLDSARLINPTFAYSFVGEGCNVHYGTSPLTPFHSAALFGNTRSTSITDTVKAAQKQFEEWCNSFRAHARMPSAITLRFLVGEATAVCRALHNLKESARLQTGVPVSQWRASILTFDPAQYEASGDAPRRYNVIDTSNLIDHVGLLNILVSVIPLRTADGIVYTESLLYKGEDATKELSQRLCADLGTMSLLLGVIPVDYLSSFSSRCNTHEVMMHTTTGGQFHQLTTWKSPTSADVLTDARPSIIFDNLQLGTFLWDMYHRMFEDEDSRTFSAKYNSERALGVAQLVQYNRESFALFLGIVRFNLALTPEGWDSVMERFFSLQEGDTTMPMDTMNRQDLHAYLYRYKVFTVPAYRGALRRVGRFSEWPSLPQLVRVVLTVPRSVLDDVFSGSDVGTPILQCDVEGKWTMNCFSAIHVAFGRVTAAGTRASPLVIFEEDKEALRGKSDLVASFTMPTQLLVNLEPQENLSVSLSTRGTGPYGAFYAKKLGLKLHIFSAKFLDKTAVHVLPEPQSSPISADSASQTASPSPPIGLCGPVAVSLDEECEQASWLSVRVVVQEPAVVQSFGSLGETPQVRQLSPCVVSLDISGATQNVIFPYPVRGDDYRLRLARKSLWIELLVPPSGPFRSGGVRCRPFPVTMPASPNSEPLTWNIHYVNLSRLPVLDCSKSNSKELAKWLNPHLASMMSTRERRLRKKEEKDTLMFVKDTLHGIMVRASGTQGGKIQRLFSLCDAASNNSDTTLFIDEVRYDLSAQTVVCDAFVLPLTGDFVDKHAAPFGKLIHNGDLCTLGLLEGELTWWKHLIPALVERCRVSWTHGPNCEYKALGRIPLTEEIEQNPICSCGRGKDVQGMSKRALWRPFAPHVTRIALSPLFAVTYLEPILRDINARRCWLCRGKAKAGKKLQECTGCRAVRYCGPECQKKDWPVHKKKCSKAA